MRAKCVQEGRISDRHALEIGYAKSSLAVWSSGARGGVVVTPGVDTRRNDRRHGLAAAHGPSLLSTRPRHGANRCRVVNQLGSQKSFMAE